MSVRVSLRGMLRLIRVDTLRRVHNVDFLAERLMYSVIVSVLVATIVINMVSLVSPKYGVYIPCFVFSDVVIRLPF